MAGDICGTQHVYQSTAQAVQKTLIGPWTVVVDGHTAVRGSSFDSL